MCRTKKKYCSKLSCKYNRGAGCNMSKFTTSIRFGLTPWLFRRIRAEARQQKVSVNELVRLKGQCKTGHAGSLQNRP
jgi:hypothetical protein